MKGTGITKSIRLGLYEAGEANLTRSWNYRQLSSPFSRIYLITEGKAVVRHNGTAHQLRAGDLHLIPCHTSTDYQCPKQHTQYFAGFTLKLETGFDLFALHSCTPTLRAEKQHYDLFEQLVETTRPFAAAHGRLSNANLPLAVELETRGLILQLAAAFLQTTPESMEQNERFSAVFQFIDANLACIITLETLAEISGLTPTYFSDLFYKTVKVRPVEFINRRRIEEAQLLLGSTNLTIQEIADAVGINSPAYFSRLFTRISGLPPRRYRKLLRNI